MSAQAVNSFPLEVRARWAELLSRSGTWAPNVDPARYEATVRALGPGITPHIAIVEGGGMVIAREQVRREQHRIGYVQVPSMRLRCLDVVYEGLLIDYATEGARDRICDYMTRVLAGGVDVIALNHVRCDSPIFKRLLGMGAVVEQAEPHWVLPLVPGSFEETLSHRTGKHRGNLRRMDKKLSDEFGGDLRLVICTRSDEVPMFLDAAAEISRVSYHGAIGAGVADTELWRSILATEAAACRWRGYLLQGKSQAIAYETGAIYDNVYHLAATSFKPEYRQLGPGTVLLMRVIADLCKIGATQLDFGFGDAEYKRSNATTSWNEATVRLYGTTISGRVARSMRRWTTKLSSKGREHSVAAQIKRAWRRMLSYGRARAQ